MSVSPEAQDPNDRLVRHPIIRLSVSVLVSWLIAGLVFAITFATSWTEYWNGFLVGIFHWGLLAIVFLPVMFAIFCVAYFLTRRGKYHTKTMRLLAAGLPLLFLGSTLLSMIIRPLTARSRLETLLQCKVPESIKIEKSFFEGGGISDVHQKYFLTGSLLDLETLKLCAGFKAAEATPDSNATTHLRASETASRSR
jgi:hypothetical protein